MGMNKGWTVMDELKRLGKVISYLRTEVSEELPIRHLEILLYIENKKEVSILQLASDLNLPKSVASKAVSGLAKEAKRVTPGGALTWTGLGLLEKERDPVNQRLVLATLSSKGKEVLSCLKTLLEA